MAVPIAPIQQQVASPMTMALDAYRQRQEGDLIQAQQQAIQQEQQAKQERQFAMQQAIGSLFDPDSPMTDESLLQAMVQFPELKDVLMEPYKNKTEEDKANDFRTIAEFQTMIEGGNVEMANARLDRLIEAANNSNRPQDAKVYELAKEQLQTNPEMARRSLRAQMFAIDPDRAKTWAAGIDPEAPEATSKQRDYQFYAQQETAAGRTPLSFNDWDRQARAAGATQVTVGSGQEARTPFEKKVDERAAEVVLDWTTGGRSRAQQNVSEFRRISDELKSGRINTRTIADFMPFASEEARKLFNEPAAEAVNDIRAIAFQVLRETLGAQFTEKEGERLMATYFDPKLSEEANIKRMDRLANLTEQLVEDKDRLATYMDKNRTAIGFKSIADDPMQAVRDLVDQEGEIETGGNQVPEGVDPAVWEVMTDEQKKLWR